MPVLFHRLATREFISARRWYARRSFQAEEQFVATIEETLRAIEASPSIGAPFTGNICWRRLRKFPYLIYYEPITASHIYVYAIAHGRRRLGYWTRRTGRP